MSSKTRKNLVLVLSILIIGILVCAAGISITEVVIGGYITAVALQFCGCGLIAAAVIGLFACWLSHFPAEDGEKEIENGTKKKVRESRNEATKFFANIRRFTTM